jgi:DNA-binding response OmpR family regulator
MKQATIAIIEDEPSIRQLYTFRFQNDGYRVVSAENGKTGLELIEKEQPDLVLLDILMPEMGGDEMLAELRKTKHGRDMKVIILTNVSSLEAPTTLKQLGITRYIVKAEMTPHQVADIVKAELDS